MNEIDIINFQAKQYNDEIKRNFMYILFFNLKNSYKFLLLKSFKKFQNYDNYIIL